MNILKVISELGCLIVSFEKRVNKLIIKKN